MMNMAPHGMVPDDIDEISDTPTIKEYKKLKRVMKIMVKFYQDGSAAKLAQQEEMDENLYKVQEDLKMVAAQLEALRKFPTHPKRSAYENELLEEQAGLKTMCAKFLKKAQEFKGLHEWSNGIVDVTRWLEMELDHYCVNHLGMTELVTSGYIESVRAPPALNVSAYKQYKAGLDEITFNLEESQDFFAASIDGRLNKFHNIEKEIIEAQLAVIREFPPINPRQQHWQDELERDLQFVEGNMVVDGAAMQKRHRMLAMHTDFTKVLRWYRDKLNAFKEEHKDDEEIIAFELQQAKIVEQEKASSTVEYMKGLQPVHGCPVMKQA